MSNQRLLSIKEAAAKLGVHRNTLGVAVRKHGIQVHPLPYNGKGKGLDSAAINELRKAFGKPARRERAAQSA